MRDGRDDALTRLMHGRTEVVVHALRPEQRSGDAPPLLLLHELGRSSAGWWTALEQALSDWLSRWKGPIHGLDFAGHGESGRLHGGAYAPEHYLAEADMALESIGDRAVVAGAGIGAYVALLLAGARPDRVHAALLLPGRGMAGAGPAPTVDSPAVTLEDWESRIERDAAAYDPGTDPMVSLCDHEYRPEDYVREFAARARRLLVADVENPRGAPPVWWEVVRAASRAEPAPRDLSSAFARLAEGARDGDQSSGESAFSRSTAS